jgi:hypothetical protein
MTGRKPVDVSKITTRKPAKRKVESSNEESDYEVEEKKLKKPAAKRTKKSVEKTKSKQQKSAKDETDKPAKKPKVKSEDGKPWKRFELLAELEGIDQKTSENIVNLLEDDLEIPFLARYRKELTGNLEAERLRDIKNTYQHIVSLELKADGCLKTIERENLLTPEIKFQIESAKSLEELELLYAPFKPTSKVFLN